MGRSAVQEPFRVLSRLLLYCSRAARLFGSCSAMRRSPDVYQHLIDEGQQLLQRSEMTALAGHHMLDATRDGPVEHVTVRTQVHDKRPVDGQRGRF
jgi:hypothetical protein